MAMVRSASQIREEQEPRASNPTKGILIEYLKPVGGIEIQYKWHLDSMEDPDRDVLETFDRIAGTASVEDRSRARQNMRDIGPSPLCDFCNHIFTHLKPIAPNEKLPVYFVGLCTPDRMVQSNAQFENSATELACLFCRSRWNQLELNERQSIAKNLREDDITLHFKTLPLFLKFKYPFADLPKTVLLTPCYDTEVIPLSSVSKSCDSATSWALANFWLQRCIHGHEKCQRLASKDSKLPTRLIDLGPEADTVQPRLCHSVDLPYIPKYATLSHRWSGTIMPMLTLFNIQYWLNAIPVSNLSLTFKEAMEATKRLGLQYLWIDSLCIIQNSEEDWRRESAAMGDVYRNSYCSISAAAGHSINNKGLFVQREPSDVHPCVIKPLHPLYEGRDNQAWYCIPRDLFKQNVTNSPLFARGWVVQEHILAPRILHFTKQQLFWECAELQACESLPAGVLDTKMMRQKKLSIDLSSLEVEVAYRNSHYINTAARQFLWNEVVERFSRTTLTCPDKDKLAALSGLAKAIGVKSEYLAGLWRDNLVVHLMWGRYAGNAILERPQTYQAPSWSWASVNGGIFTTRVWPTKGYRVVAEVLESSVELLSSDPTGPVTGGHLRLRGCLAPVTVRKWPPREGCSEIWHYDIRKDPSRNDNMHCHPDIDFAGDELQFHVFLITLRAQYPQFDYGAGDGILLEPTGNGKGEFYRRGRVMCGPYQRREEMLPFLNVFRFSSNTLDPEHYICKTEFVEPVNILPMYEISII